MTQATDQELFAQFLAFKAQQEGGTAAPGKPTPDETPKPTLPDVLKALVHRAGLPDENTVRAYCDVVDEYFAAQSETTVESETTQE